MLQERGYYTIDYGEEKIELRFCTWTFKRFCEIKGLGLQSMYKAILDDMSIGDIVLLLLCAAEYVKVKNKEQFTYTDFDASEWIDSMGGLAGAKFLGMFNNIAHSMSDPTEKIKEGKEGKKKK